MTPPPDYDLPLSEIARWLSAELSKIRRQAKDRVVVVNLDGREIPPQDETMARAAMVNLNALLRRQPKTLVLWPVNSESFASSMIERLTDAGGQSAIVDEKLLRVEGLPKERFFDALQLILSTMAVRLDDAALSVAEVQDLADECDTVGAYLEKVNVLVASRYDISAIGTKLPKLYIAITSTADTTPSCRILRRGSQFFIDPDRLLQVSRANIADDWRRRASSDARKSLSFISSLLEVKLVNVSASAVVNACAFGNDQELARLVRNHYPKPIKTNAANSMRTMSLYRALKGEDDVSPTRTSSSKEIQDAYRDIQQITNRKHKEINKAIVKVLTDQLDIRMPGLLFEHAPLPEKGLRTDVWFERGERPETIELTHQKPTEAGEASIASYVLNKVQDYARDYQLI